MSIQNTSSFPIKLPNLKQIAFGFLSIIFLLHAFSFLFFLNPFVGDIATFFGTRGGPISNALMLFGANVGLVFVFFIGILPIAIVWRLLIFLKKRDVTDLKLLRTLHNQGSEKLATRIVNAIFYLTVTVIIESALILSGLHPYHSPAYTAFLYLFLFSSDMGFEWTQTAKNVWKYILDKLDKFTA